MKPLFTIALSVTCLLCPVFAWEQPAETDNESEVADSLESDKNPTNYMLVTAELRETNVLRLPTSVTVVDENTIGLNNAQHAADIFNLAPNVNFATGASRGRFIQIRGVGERSEFTEPVNYSVGVVVDGVDMTGVAGAATLLDVQQVEILRGPQGTLFGANALAGLVNIVSNQPSASQYSKLIVGLEEFGARQLSLVNSGPASENLGYRVAVGRYQSDGYMENIFLGRSDTNSIDEITMKGQLVYSPSRDFKLTTNLIYVDADNGYDAFSLDSNRQTYSDEPGEDKQRTNALSLISDWRLSDQGSIKLLLSGADSEIDYGYDEDWSHTGICDGTACDSELFGFDWWYSSFDQYLRDNQNLTADLRYLFDSADGNSQWSAGVYFREQSVDLVRRYTFNPEDFSNQYDTQNAALYGQYERQIDADLKLISGLRLEHQNADYADSQPSSYSRSENLWGGKIALEYQYAAGEMLYALISRGYKAGGFNTAQIISASEREYETEYMWNYEIGFKGYSQASQLTWQAAFFYQDRTDIHSKQSLVQSQADGRTLQEGGECPCSFTDYTVNANGGLSYGLESEIAWRGADSFNLYATLGLLKTEFKDLLSFTHSEADLAAIPPVPFDLTGRSVAHAPEYQFVLGANLFLDQYWTLNLQVEGKDEFYLSDRHEVKTDAYETANINLRYQQENWHLDIYGRNLANKDIQTRGFGSFGNDPRNFYETEAYFQFAAPRLYGIKASYEF